MVQHNDADGNWDGTWDASYDLVVTNPGTEGQVVNYSLTDTPQFADGVAINDRVVTSETGTANTGWNGKDPETDQVASQVALAAGATHTYTVKINVSFGADIAKDERTCAAEGTEGGQGLLNSGTLTSGNESITDEDCLDIPAPEANVVKTATGATENPDGTWAVGYTVVVNNDSDVATRYDLTDTLRFGKGLNVTEASWELKDTDVKGAWETPGTEKSEAMAEGRAPRGTLQRDLRGHREGRTGGRRHRFGRRHLRVRGNPARPRIPQRGNAEAQRFDHRVARLHDPGEEPAQLLDGEDLRSGQRRDRVARRGDRLHRHGEEHRRVRLHRRNRHR